jgi:hypothetical protein
MKEMRRRIAVLLAIMLVVGNVLAALSPLARATSTSEPAFVTDAVLGKMVLCQAHPGGKPGTSDSDNDGSGGNGCCPLCGSPALPMPGSTIVVLVERPAMPGTVGWNALGLPTLADHLRLGGINGRGPPARA